MSCAPYYLQVRSVLLDLQNFEQHSLSRPHFSPLALHSLLPAKAHGSVNAVMPKPKPLIAKITKISFFMATP